MVISRLYVVESTCVSVPSSEQYSSNVHNCRLKLCGTCREWRKWFSCKALQNGKQKGPVGSIYQEMEGQCPEVRKCDSRKRKVRKWWSLRLGMNRGFPRMGSRGESEVVRDICVKICEHKWRTVGPIRGCSFMSDGRLSKHHGAPFSYTCFWACSICTQSLPAKWRFQSISLPRWITY